MGNPLNAFGVYAAERSPEYKYIPVGAEGYISEGVLNFVQDRFYVKLSGFGENGKNTDSAAGSGHGNLGEDWRLKGSATDSGFVPIRGAVSEIRKIHSKRSARSRIPRARGNRCLQVCRQGFVSANFPGWREP